MIIRDLLYLASAGKRKNARKASVQRLTVGLCVVTTAAALGVVTGILVAPRSGEETRAGLKKGAVKSVATIKSAILEKADAVKNFTADAAKEVAGTIEGATAKEKTAKKDE
jgi:gas vesicle protein